MADFDSIVIGSGAGGLTAAVALARSGQRVCVLEQHYVPGGWCHSFTLEGFRFSPGVHYLGELHEGGMFRKIYEGLGVANDLHFLELNPDGFEHVRIGNERFDIPRGKAKFVERLCQRFPQEAKGICGYLDLIERISLELRRAMHMSTVADVVKLPFTIPTTIRHGLFPLEKTINRFITDPVLKAILTIQGGDYALPPSAVPTAMHAAVIGHYFEGGYYPKGGGFRLPRAFVRELKRNGGEIRLEAEVAEILVRDGKTHGVRLANGDEISADRVISNADPNITYGKLVAPEHLSGRLLRRLDRTRYSASALSLFLGVDYDARGAGLDSGNYWYSKTPCIEDAYQPSTSIDRLARGDVPSLFMTCTTLKDPLKRKDGLHTMEAFTFVPYGPFKQWANTEFGERPEDYERMKDAVMDRMLDSIEDLAPGLRESIVFKSLGTPVTNWHYVRATEGNLYGTEKTLSQIGPFGFQPKSPIKDLWLCGASTVAHGIMGATISGLVAASQILKTHPLALLTAEGQSLTVESAEDVVVPKRTATKPAPAVERVAAVNG